jgi:uncharacterized protein (TIGR03086 family)
VSEPDRIDLLQRALAQTGALIAHIAPEQRALPTPCEGWDVAALVTHVVGGLDNFAAMARGEKPDWGVAPPPLGDDWAGTFRAKADALLDTWRGADPARQPAADMQITEQAVHAWDIARATGQPVDRLDPAVCEHALDHGRTMLKPEYRGQGAFDAEVRVAADAPVQDRLAAWFGRDPSAG